MKRAIEWAMGWAVVMGRWCSGAASAQQQLVQQALKLEA